MGRNNIIILSLLFIITLIACKGPKTESPKVESPAPIANLPTVEFDSYFSEREHFDIDIGPRSITRNILQDSKGYFWLASWEGIVGYDGNSFTNYTKKEPLRRFRSFAIHEDSRQNIWFATIGAGIYRYDGSSFENLDRSNGLVFDEVACFYEDSSNRMWIGTEDGLSVYDNGSFTNYKVDGPQTNSDINAIVEISPGQFWLGSRGEAHAFDGTKFTRILRQGELSFGNVRSIIKSSDGDIWLGGNDGLWRYQDGTFENISKQFIGYIFEDSQGSIWTSQQSKEERHEMNLYKYSMTPLPMQKIEAAEIANPRGQVFGITESSDGKIWFGTEAGIGYVDEDKVHYFDERHYDQNQK